MSDRKRRELERKAACGDEQAQKRLEHLAEVPVCPDGKHKGPWTPIVYRTLEQIDEERRKAAEAVPYLNSSYPFVPLTAVDFAYPPTHEVCDHCGARRRYFRICTGRKFEIMQPHTFTQIIDTTP